MQKVFVTNQYGGKRESRGIKTFQLNFSAPFSLIYLVIVIPHKNNVLSQCNET